MGPQRGSRSHLRESSAISKTGNEQTRYSKCGRYETTPLGRMSFVLDPVSRAQRAQRKVVPIRSQSERIPNGILKKTPVFHTGGDQWECISALGSAAAERSVLPHPE